MSDWDDATADWYAEKYGDDPSVFAVVNAAKIPPGAAVIDIGCGTGSGLRALAGRAGRLTGVDPTRRMIANARAQTPSGDVDFHVAGAEALPVGDASQDVALAINAVHHWADEGRGLAEAFRVLKPGGRLVIGGERFGAQTVPGGQDYTARLKAAGFRRVQSHDIAAGFITIAHKPAGRSHV